MPYAERRFSKKLATLLTLPALAVGVYVLAPQPADAQASGWQVFRNCNTSPCVIGVSTPDYARANNANYLAGWRGFSQVYSDNASAWRRACFEHYGNPNHTAPDIVNGTFDCSTVCSNGTCL